MTDKSRWGFEPASLRKWIPAGVAVVLLVGAAAAVVSRELVSPEDPKPPARKASGFVRFSDPPGGISISYPAGWRRVASPDPQVRLSAEGDGSSMLVRISDFPLEVGPQTLGPAKRLTDKLVRSVPKAKLVRPPQRIALGELPGYLYLYTFPDPASGQRGAHAHYFLFRGQTVITIVFQTVPSERLAELAPLFDRIGGTLRATPA